jgi:tRNA pseudouridine55 synthase
MNVVINFNKPENISSHQAVTKVKRFFAAKKAGHTGTLDPIATGILIVCLNEATKIARFLSDLDKEYVVRLKLGERTDTYDLTGRIVEEKEFCPVKAADISRTLEKLTGTVKQKPPMYSAVKIGGTRLYKLARKGLDIERPERTVQISRIDLISVHLPYLDLRVNCSKGTYIRTLCDDIGMELGIGGHMVSLQRTRVGDFRIENSVSLEDLGNRSNPYYSIDFVLSELSEIILDGDSYRKAKNGMPIRTYSKTLPHCSKDNKEYSGNLYQNRYVRLKTPDNVLFGIGRFEGDEIKIERLLNSALERPSTSSG